MPLPDFIIEVDSDPIELVVSGAQGAAGVSGSDTYAGLSDAASVNLPTVNTPLATALAGKQPVDAALTALAAGSEFVQFTGPTTSTKVFTLPNASSTLLYAGGALGTPASGTLTNCTGLPPSGVTGTAVVTADSRLSDARTPTAHATSHAFDGSDPFTNFTNGTIAGTLNFDATTINFGTGAAAAFRTSLFPATGIAAALNVNIGSAGAPVLFDGAGGTPSSIVLTNATGTASALNIGGNAATATALANARTIGGSSFDGSGNVTSFPAPGAIGGTTPSTGVFTTLTVNGGNPSVEYIQVGASGGGLISSSSGYRVGNGGGVYFSNGNDYALGLRRGSGATLLVGTGAAGSFAGNLKATNGEFVGTLSVTGTTTATGGLIGGIQALSGAGAVNITTLTTAFTSTGLAQALTLADGANGQIKTIVHDVDGGSGVLTPTTKTGFTTITLNNAGDTVTLQFFTTRGWMVIASFGSVIA